MLGLVRFADDAPDSAAALWDPEFTDVPHPTRHHWRVTEARALRRPVPCTGKQALFFRLPSNVTAQLSHAPCDSSVNHHHHMAHADRAQLLRQCFQHLTTACLCRDRLRDGGPVAGYVHLRASTQYLSALVVQLSEGDEDRDTNTFTDMLDKLTEEVQVAQEELRATPGAWLRCSRHVARLVEHG